MNHPPPGRLEGIPRFLSERLETVGGFPQPPTSWWFGRFLASERVIAALRDSNSHSPGKSNGWYNSCYNGFAANPSCCEGGGRPLPPSQTLEELQLRQQQQQEQRLWQQQQLEELPPCTTCRYTGMAVCAGLSLYFLRLATEETAVTMAKTASKNAKNPNHTVFFYGGALVWAAAGVYRSMLDD